MTKDSVPEKWLPVSGYTGSYEVSSLGRVKSLLSHGRILKQTINSVGYERVALRKDGITKFVFVHRLVARAFIDNPEKKPYVDHIDGDRRNNSASNLRWCTMRENCNFPIAIMRKKDSHVIENSPWYGKQGKDHPSSKSVAQYDLCGVKIREYNGISEASRETGVDIANISSCCRLKRMSAGGFIWRYKNKD